MARELLVSTATGTTVYAIARISADGSAAAAVPNGQWANITNSNFENFVAANWTQYAIVMAELTGTGLFEATVPTFFVEQMARFIDVIFFTQAGGSPDAGDTKISASGFQFADAWVATAALTV